MVKDIVGAQIGSTITNDARAVLQAAMNGRITRLLSRPEMELMASFDLGQRCRNMAASDTIFFIDDETGVITPPVPFEQMA